MLLLLTAFLALGVLVTGFALTSVILQRKALENLLKIDEKVSLLIAIVTHLYVAYAVGGLSMIYFLMRNSV